VQKEPVPPQTEPKEPSVEESPDWGGSLDHVELSDAEEVMEEAPPEMEPRAPSIEEIPKCGGSIDHMGQEDGALEDTPTHIRVLPLTTTPETRQDIVTDTECRSDVGDDKNVEDKHQKWEKGKCWGFNGIILHRPRMSSSVSIKRYPATCQLRSSSLSSCVWQAVSWQIADDDPIQFVTPTTLNPDTAI
jgi:hypothetical protein